MTPIQPISGTGRGKIPTLISPCSFSKAQFRKSPIVPRTPPKNQLS